jgi:hypothetical protein
MPEIRGFERSHQEAGEAGDGRSDAPMDIAMDMATAATSTAMETAGIALFEPKETDENRKRQ